MQVLSLGDRELCIVPIRYSDSILSAKGMLQQNQQNQQHEEI
jgi:hypothetical protein